MPTEPHTFDQQVQQVEVLANERQGFVDAAPAAVGAVAPAPNVPKPQRTKA